MVRQSQLLQRFICVGIASIILLRDFCLLLPSGALLAPTDIHSIRYGVSPYLLEKDKAVG